MLVTVYAKRAGLVHLGEYLVGWSSPAHVCHENWLREGLPERYSFRDEIGDARSELHEKARFWISTCTPSGIGIGILAILDIFLPF